MTNKILANINMEDLKDHLSFLIDDAYNEKLIYGTTYKKYVSLLGKKKIRMNTLKKEIDKLSILLTSTNSKKIKYKPKKNYVLEFKVIIYMPIVENEQKHDKRQLIVFKEDKKKHIKGKHSDIIHNGVLPEGDIWKTSSQEFQFQGNISFYNQIMQYKNHPVLFNSGTSNVDDFHFFMLLGKIDETKYLELMNAIEAILLSSGGKLLLEIFDLSKVLKSNVIADFGTKPHKRDQYINNKYIKYSSDYKNIYKTEYVKNNFLPNSCVLSCIIDVFKEKFENYYTSKTLTYKSLYQMIYPNKTLQKSDNAVCINDLIEGFFKPYNLECYFMDKYKNIRVYNKPEKRNTNLKLVSYYILSNCHIHHINNDINELHQIRDKFFEKEGLSKAKNTFSFFKPTEGETYKIVHNAKDIMNIINEESENKIIHCLYEDNELYNLWNELYIDYKYEATPYFSESNMTKFYIENIGDKKITVFSYKQRGVIQDIHFISVDNFISYEKKKALTTSQLLNKNYLSTYSESAQKLFMNIVKGGIISNFLYNSEEGTYIKDSNGMMIYEKKETKFLKMDINKCYTSILKDLEYIPIVNSFDEFIVYDNHEIEDYTLYYVCKTDDEINYLSKRYELTYGINLKTIRYYKIISFLRMSKLKKNISNEIIKDIYNDKFLTEKMKKGIINHLIGMYDKKKNKKEHVFISGDEEECNLYQKDFTGRVVRHKLKEDEYIYHTVIKNESEMIEGFKPLSLLIKDIANVKLFKLKKELQSVGFDCYKCNTDCWYVQHDEEKLEIFKKKYPNYFNYKDTNSYEAIGKLKYEVEEITPITIISEVRENKNVYTEVYENEVIPILIESEKDFDKTNNESIINYNNEILQHLDKNVCVLGECAGSGKSSACMNVDGNILIVCKFNALCIERRNEGFSSITLNKLLGIGFDGSNEKNMKEYDIDEYDVIILEEIGLYDTYNLVRIKQYMEKHKDKRFLANGDVFQLAPIEFDLNVIDTTKYYKKIIDKIFPNQILLKHCKRCDTNEDNKLVDEISKKFREFQSVDEAREFLKKSNFKKIFKPEDISTRKNCVGLNRTADMVNNLLHKYVDNQKYYVGMELLGKKTFKNKECHIHINYTYTITEIKDKHCILEDGENKHTILISLLDKYLKLSYSQTAHSLQGFTIKEPITVFDLYSNMITVSWLYVAITRSRNLKDITLYWGKTANIGEKAINDLLKNRILGHLESDKNRNMNGEYITVEWIKDKISKTKCCSGVNNKECNRLFDYNDPESFSVDRINNEIAHFKENSQILCRSCNSSKK
jgi:hypothetical protein